MVVALLRELQDAHGFISLELKERVEQVTGVSPNYLKCLIRMYPTLKEENTVHEIIACTGERCGKKEGGAILNALKRELRIQKMEYLSMENLNFEHKTASKSAEQLPIL